MSDDRFNDYLFKQYVANSISRRRFMGTLAATGVSATLIGSLTAGRARAATPKKGGVLIMGVPTADAKDSLDPTKLNTTANLVAAFAVYDLLVNRDTDLRPIPMLATGWTPNDNATEWVFDLRSGVTFHNGKDFTADDVIYSLSRHTAEGSESPTKSFLSQITSMQKTAPLQVKFTLASSNADFPITLSDTRVPISPAGVDDFSGAVYGTGPFKVATYDPSNRVEFVRNDDYWGEVANVDTFEMIGIGDPTARVNALVAGDINCLLQLDPISVQLLERSDAAQVLRANSGAQINLAMMLDRAPTDNNDLRLAMKYAVDRQQIVDNVLKGYGGIGNDHPVAPNDPFYCSDIPQRAYDPEQARFHIRKAGLENTPIDLYASDVPGSGALSACQVFQQSAQAAGVNINLIQPPADTYWSAVWMQKPMIVSGWDARPVPDLILSIAFQSGVSYNETAWANERFDQILVEARGITDFDKRKELYCEVQMMLHENGGHIPLAFRDYLDAHANEVMGMTPHGAGPMGFFQGPRTAWIDA